VSAQDRGRSSSGPSSPKPPKQPGVAPVTSGDETAKRPAAAPIEPETPKWTGGQRAEERPRRGVEPEAEPPAQGAAAGGRDAEPDRAPPTARAALLDGPFSLARRLRYRPRARAVEAEAEAEAELGSGPPSIPSAASVAEPAGSAAAAEALGPVTVLPGHVIADRYEVVATVGEGGMGIVYQCRDQLTHQTVALKRVMVPDGQVVADYMTWFYKESRALAALDHPGIVRARDFGQLVDGSPYLVMDFVRGVSLHDLIHTRLPFAVVWSITDQVLAALAHAHARGIVHGDLKPSNVLVQELDGQPPRVRILDFGLAWLKQDPHDERLDGTKALEFAPHAGAGTPGYMAPEQIQHEMHHVCGATDLYALGCILYRQLGGRAPFKGESEQLLRKHAFEKPPELRPVVALPEGATEFVTRLLAKRPWDRWEFAAEARAEWARLRPTADVDPSIWRLPIRPRPAEDTGTPTHESVRTASGLRVAAFSERAPGLLSLRPSPLVGRDDVRTMLLDLTDDVVEGRGAPHGLVVLTGTAGVGKSRIAEWLCEVVHEAGSMVPLRARYRSISTSLDGMLGAVTQYYNFERVERDTIERSLLARWKIGRNDTQGRTWVAGVAEWLRPLGPMSDEPIGPSGMRFALDTLETRRMVVRYTLRRIARNKPVLLWLDDLQHASDGAVEGLFDFLEEAPQQRVLIIATLRSEELNLETRAVDNLQKLREILDGQVVEIKPMAFEETCALLKASLPLDDAAAQEAARRSRGNPLFALQQLHAWALAGNMELVDGLYRVPREVLALRPQTTAELWDSRVAAMPAEDRVGAYAAASLGADIRRTVLHALLASLGLPADAVIQSLQNAEIVLPRGAGRYMWPHALLYEHLNRELLVRDDSRRILRAASEALRRHPLATTRRVVRQRALNLLQAGDPESAAALLFEHVQRAWSGARDPSAALADLELLKGKLQGHPLALKHRWQAEALRHVARPGEAAMHAEIARAGFQEAGDKENLAQALRLLGQLRSEQGNSAAGLQLVEQAHGIFVELGHVEGQAQCEAAVGEIHYMLGHYDEARRAGELGERHFAELKQPLGRGQCLLLLSWLEHSEGMLERARRVASDARAEFGRCGYRLGMAQADASLAHVEHRLMNYYGAERGALEALNAFSSLKTPRGQAACARLLAMVALDTDDIDVAQSHAERAMELYSHLGDPWGTVEASLIACQVHLARHDLVPARELIERIRRDTGEEVEPRQHLLLTRAWLEMASGNVDQAFKAVDAAAEVFDQRSRAGDHTPHLLGRLSRYAWPKHALGRIEAWRTTLTERSRLTRT
jgi:serine/threonine protein kinase/tetratricopeptide (TPR) repeat protein